MDEATCREIAVIFCHELVGITKAMHESTGSLTSRKTLQFLYMIRNTCFNPQFTDVTDFLSDIELLKFTRAFTQIPCAHLGIGKHVTTKVIERLGSINPAEIPALIQALHALPLSERLDLAQLFPNLFRDLELQSTDDHEAMQMPKSAKAGDETRQQAINVMARVMTKLHQGATSALEELALTNAQNNSLLELQAKVRPEGLQNRIHEQAMHDAQTTHEHLAKHMHLSTVVQKNERIVTIGNNAVGIMGPTGVIRDIELCEHMKLTEEAPFSATVLEDVRNRLQLGMTNDLFFEMVDEEILSRISADTTRQEFWGHVFPDLQANELSECLEAIMNERIGRTNGASILLAEAETSIATRIQSMNRSTDAISVMMDEIRHDPFLGQFDVYLERFYFYQTVEIPESVHEHQSEKKRGIPHQAMQAIDCLILSAEQQMRTRTRISETIPSEVSVPERSPILERLKEIRDQAYAEDRTHATAFQARRSEESAQYQKTMPRNTAAIQRLNQELQKQNGREPLKAALDDLHNTYLTTLPSVDLQPTEEFLRETRFYPFEASDQEEEIKTFALLHSPEMRRTLEEQLGISYDDMSLQSLFQLGRFLRNKKPADFLDMRIVVNAQGLPPHGPDAKKNMLTSFLACSEDLELGDTVLKLGKFDWSDDLFALYANAAKNAETSAREIQALYAEANIKTELTVGDIYRELILGSNELLKRAASGKDIGSIQVQLFSESAQIRNTNYLLRLLSPEDRSQLNLNMLGSTHMHGSIPVSELKSNPSYTGILRQVVETIRKNFPKGDDIDFTERYLSDPSAEFFFSTCGDQLLAFFGTTLMPNGERYLDWFNANGDSAVRGLAEATVTTGIQSLRDHKDVYLVAKPHVRSHEIFSRMGFVTYGITEPDEYKHRYMRCRLLQEEERERYVGKNLTADDKKQIPAICMDENTMYPLTIHGEEVQVCKVHFSAVDHHDNVLPEDEKNGFILREIAGCCTDNQTVLTAYLRDPNFTNGDQVYYCLFERSILGRQQYDSLAKSVHDFHQLHSAA